MNTMKRAEDESARPRLWRVQVQGLPELDLMIVARSEGDAEEIAATHAEHTLAADEVRCDAVQFRSPRPPQEG